MGWFGTSMVAACGVLLYAVAALIWDRRREMADWIGAIDPRRRSAPKVVVGCSLLLGSVLLLRAAVLVIGLSAALLPG